MDARPRILISDSTLRDGSHAVQHQLDAEQIGSYAAAANAARVPIVEVGHGNGLGASSLQVGESRVSDREMLRIARSQLTHAQLGVFGIPGFATIRHLDVAIEEGADLFRVGAHCTEADLTERHVTYLRGLDKPVYGVLMMSHMASPERLVEEARKIESYGAHGVIIMDSAGALLLDDVRRRVAALIAGTSLVVGFHGHENVSLGMANSLAAVKEGASILDGTARGFGAGAGNTQLEVLVAVLDRLGYETGIDLYAMLDAAEHAERELVQVLPTTDSITIVSGLAGVFSGYSKPVRRIATQFCVDPRDILFALGRRSVVAGQEDVILEVANALREHTQAQREMRE
ncbi:MAG TPA: 4-hydroxy-2-oxovalerate aldolase [Pseudonocardiaceae bacterium]|nr:4-hydroxy-2-oxovalerate aldolase [Pseudonocardiaceae bacterium]